MRVSQNTGSSNASRQYNFVVQQLAKKPNDVLLVVYTDLEAIHVPSFIGSQQT